MRICLRGLRIQKPKFGSRWAVLLLSEGLVQRRRIYGLKGWTLSLMRKPAELLDEKPAKSFHKAMILGMPRILWRLSH